MASKKSLTAENLQALGAERLAQLLMDLAAGNAAMQRRLRLELTVEQAPRRVAAEVRKQLARIGRAHSFAHGHTVRALAADLETQRRAIAGPVATSDAAEALDLMWRLLELAGPVHDRSDDSNGEIGDVFRAACKDLGPLAERARPEPGTLADQAFEARLGNYYGQYDGLIATLAPALAGDGLDHLKARFVALSKTPVETPPPEQRKAIGWGMAGQFHEDEMKASRRRSTIRLALQEIADAQGDVDGYIGQYDEKARKVPGIAAEIARQLLAAGRGEEALRTLDAAEHRRGGRQDLGWHDFAWEDARIAALDALGRAADAQALRWSCFEAWLSAPHLRAFLARLPDFDDDEAEGRALDHAERHGGLMQALSFLVEWKALERAARLVTRRARELDGDRYEGLAAAADALTGKHPLAATLLRRSMIDFALAKGRSSRYRHAARHFDECARLAASVPSFDRFETHDAWAAGLASRHGRKHGFWGLVSVS